MTTVLRMHEAKRCDTPVVDVDGSFLYRKYMSRLNAGEKVSEPGPPPPPLTDWKLVSGDTFKDVALHIPLVTSGKLFPFTCVLYLFTSDVIPMQV